MLSAARRLLDSLDAHLQRLVLFPFDDQELLNWSYFPGCRQGVVLGQMSPHQVRAAMNLLEEALSHAGSEKARGIMALESILGDLEGRPPGDRTRDPDGYYLTLFGSLTTGHPWGWRIEGHHLSLTFTSVRKDLVATTPAFMGANPAEVPHGPHQGWRILKKEEDLARKLLREFEPAQKEQAILSSEAPADIITGTSRELSLERPRGLSGAEMSADQRQLLEYLVKTYALNFNEDLAEKHLKRIYAAGIEHLYFAWAGGLERGQGHYYRIQGPTLLIEYDNTQNNANHIHTVMRDLEQDFGRDLLRQHYQECEHGL